MLIKFKRMAEMREEDIKATIKDIMFEINPNFQLNDDENFFNRKSLLAPRDIVYFVLEIEERFGVILDEIYLKDMNFFTFKNLTNFIFHMKNTEIV